MSRRHVDVPECPICEERCERHCPPDKPGGCDWMFCEIDRVQGRYELEEDEWYWTEKSSLTS